MRKVDLSQEQAFEFKQLWWLFVLLGLASLAAGVILLAQPGNSLATLAVIFGIFLLIDGIVELVSSFGRAAEHRALTAIVGVLGIIVGIALIRHPLHGVSAIAILIGIWLVAVGVIRLLWAVAAPHPLLAAGLALVEVIAGVVIVANPHIGYTTLAVLAGIWLIINGIGTMFFGLLIRRARGGAPPAWLPPRSRP